MFDAVQRRLVERRTSTTPHQDGGDFVFTSLVKCGKCRSGMYGFDNAGTVRYRCQNYIQRKICDLNGVNQPELLDAVLEAITSRFDEPSTVQRLRTILTKKLTKQTKAIDMGDLRKHLAKLDTQLVTSRRNMALADGDDLRREYETVVRELRSERERLDASIQDAQKPRGRTQAELDQRIEKAVNVLSRLRDELPTAPVVKQRELLRLCIAKVEVWSSRERAGQPYRLEHGIVHLRQDMWLTEAEADNLYSTTRNTR
jgi:hypothetical protein